MPRRRSHAPGPATEVQAPMQAKGNPRPRRRPVARHPGIYYRPRVGGKVAPPYEIRYLDSSGTRRWAVVHGSLEEAEAKRAELLLRRRRGERIEPTRQSFEQYAREWLELCRVGSSGKRCARGRRRSTAGRSSSTCSPGSGGAGSTRSAATTSPP